MEKNIKLGPLYMKSEKNAVIDTITETEIINGATIKNLGSNSPINDSKFKSPA